MPTINIDGRLISDWKSFHEVFASVFGFPEFYGRNMNAWIDCMSYLDDPDAGMTSVIGTSSDIVTLRIDHIEDLCRCDQSIYDAIVECSALVNWRRMETGQSPILALSFHRSMS
jgi:hypothetical protein